LKKRKTPNRPVQLALHLRRKKVIVKPCVGRKKKTHSKGELTSAFILIGERKRGRRAAGKKRRREGGATMMGINNTR